MQQSDSKTTYYNCQFQEELPVVAGQKTSKWFIICLIVVFLSWLGMKVDAKQRQRVHNNQPQFGIWLRNHDWSFPVPVLVLHWW